MTGPDDRIAEIENRVVEFARRTAPPGWRRIDLHCSATVAASDVALTVLTGDGGISTAETVPQELTELLVDLRRACYRIERGTWFSMVAIIEPAAAQALYNREFDPLWDPPIPADHWRRDQTVMPRDGEHIPDWLSDRLTGSTPSGGPDAGGAPMNAAERTDLLSNRFTVLLADHAPPLWVRLTGHYRVVGGQVEFPEMACHRADGTVAPWTPPPAARGLLDRLRAGTLAFRGTAWARLDFDVVYENGEVQCRARFTENAEPGTATLLDEPPGPAEPDWADRLRHRLDQLRVDRAAYRVGDAADGAWCLVPHGDRWAVFRMVDGERCQEATFDDPEQAAAQLLGHVLLDPRHTVPDTPFEPLEGEPPLSLLRDRYVLELPAGTEVDRHGGSGGNVTYAARTPYPHRSLPPEWRDRPYHLYRVRRPVEALTGTAVPWFGQPGGGTAHVFRQPVAELLADGVLTEVDDA